jgi:hypothetical protein
VGGGEVKLRAVRVMAESVTYDRKAPMVPNLRGVVTREPKRDTPGTLTLVEGQEVDGHPLVLPTPLEEMRAAYADIVVGIEEMIACPELRELTLDYVLPRQRFALHELLRTSFTGIAHQTILHPSAASASSAGSGGGAAAAGPVGKAQKVRLWKIDDVSEFQRWEEEEKQRNLRKSLPDDKVTGEEGEEGAEPLEAEGADGEATKGAAAAGSSASGSGGGGSRKASANRIFFLKQDFDLSPDSSSAGILGSVRNGAVVVFDLCIDKLNGSRVAANVRVSDEATSDGVWPQLGVIEYVREGEGGGASASMAGYIRTIPHDEKLPWLSSSSQVTLL